MASTFHTPSFGDEDFEIPPVSLNTSANGHHFYSQPVGGLCANGNANSSFPASAQAPYSHPVTSIPNPSFGLGGSQQPLTHPLTHAGSPAAPFDSCSSGINRYNHIAGSLQQQQQQQQHLDLAALGVPSILPKFPPQTFDIPDIQVSNSVLGLGQSSSPLCTITTTAVMSSPPQPQPQPLPLSFQHQVAPHMHAMAAMDQSHLNIPAGAASHQGSPPNGSSTNSPGRESIGDSSDDSLPLSQLATQKRTTAKSIESTAAKKAKAPKKKKKKDPNEPQKPVSAYALFFRDTQAAIKSQNPSASFGEVSKIVASMWDGLEDQHKGDYKKRTELAKKEYLKQLAAYRASLVSRGELTNGDKLVTSSQRVSPPKNLMPATSSMPPPAPPPSLLGPGTSPLSHLPGPATVVSAPMMLGDMAPPHNHPSSMMHQHMDEGMKAATGLPTIAPRPTHPANAQPINANAPPMSVEAETYNYSQVIQGRQQDGRLMASHPPIMCVRSGCCNRAIDSPGWDSEYCSNECVVSHCRDVFTAWVADRQGSSSYASVK